MHNAILATYGTYHPHHQRLKQLGCSPCERDVFGKIAGLIHRLDRAFVHLREFAEELGYARESISRALTRLEEKNLVRRTGKKVFGFFPVVEILPLDSPPADAPFTKRSTVQTINHKKRKQIKIKNSQKKLFVPKKLITSTEKIASKKLSNH